jgi:Tol biopolymer transport system component
MVDANGSNETNLTQKVAEYSKVRSEFLSSEPSWSPDGSKLLWHSQHKKGAEIYIANAVTKEVTKVAKSPGLVQSESVKWSPDGLRIAYVSNRNLYVVDSDGRNEINLSKNEDGKASLGASWSPDSKRVAFIKGPRSLLFSDNSSEDLMVAAADGRTPAINLTKHAAETKIWLSIWTRLKWTPDSSSVIFAARSGGYEREVCHKCGAESRHIKEGQAAAGNGERTDLFNAAADGTGVTNLSKVPPGAEASNHTISPDGKQVLYDVALGELSPEGKQLKLQKKPMRQDIFSVGIKGGTPTNITQQLEGIRFHSPTWSPKGTKFSFQSGPLGRQELFTCASDGTAITQVSKNPALIHETRWHPDGERLLNMWWSPNLWWEMRQGKR